MYVDPSSINKYLYIKNTPAWKVRLLYSFGIFSWLLVVYGFSGMIIVDPFFRWFVGPIIALFTVYHLLSYTLNLYYRRFNLTRHKARIKKYWNEHSEPTVDIFLPICGEDIVVLDNTWKNVSQLRYKNIQVYVLDDSVSNCRQHRQIAQRYGFSYFERPNKGAKKKAGNLKYAYERTHGDFITIFDADFAPLTFAL